MACRAQDSSTELFSLYMSPLAKHSKQVYSPTENLYFNQSSNVPEVQGNDRIRLVIGILS
jgi:hypothetical protein